MCTTQEAGAKKKKEREKESKGEGGGGENLNYRFAALHNALVVTSAVFSRRTFSAGVRREAEAVTRYSAYRSLIGAPDRIPCPVTGGRWISWIRVVYAQSAGVKGPRLIIPK